MPILKASQSMRCLIFKNMTMALDAIIQVTTSLEAQMVSCSLLMIYDAGKGKV